MEEVTLVIEDQIFKVDKQILCQYSDYFCAMLSGNYLENSQKEINIDVIKADSMQILIKYMTIGLIDLSEYSLATIGDLAVAANFLQITELIKQIEYVLDLQTTESNWMEIMTIAENASYSKLEHLAAAFGLFSFISMKPEHIPSIKKIFWYLSHSYINANSELDIFNFGYHWMLNNETGTDSLLMVLGCLDINRISCDELKEIQKLMNDHPNSLASKVIDCLLDLSNKNIELSARHIAEKKQEISELFTDRVYKEVCFLLNESKRRKLVLTPAIPMWVMKESKLENVPHNLFTFNLKSGFEKWLEVAVKDLWGWSVVSWGLTRVVVVCGEHGRGTGMFMKDVKAYDTLRKEWINHGVDLPQRRHGGVVVIGDSLYILGGVGGFRVVLDTAIIYNLQQRTYRKIAKFPEAIQNPAVCSHKGEVYGAGNKNIFKYEDLGDTDRWINVVGTDIRMSCMTSFKDYIYCTQNYFSHLYRFKPNVDTKLEVIAHFTNPPATISNLGDQMLFFTRSVCGQSDMIAVEQYTGNKTEKSPKVVWTQPESDMKIYDVAGSCVLVMDLPPLNTEVSNYAKHYLRRYIDLEPS